MWENPYIETWYRQNIMFFVEKEFLKSQEKLSLEAEKYHEFPLNLVHPDRYLDETDPGRIDVKQIRTQMAWKALKYQTKILLYEKLHWRVQRIFRSLLE